VGAAFSITNFTRLPSGSLAKALGQCKKVSFIHIRCMPINWYIDFMVDGHMYTQAF
jgi:hypothetical protein